MLLSGKCVEAARKYKRIVQHGTQSRTSGSWARRIAAVQSGTYGRLLVSKGYCCKPRWSIGYKPYENPPQNVHFDTWLRPAPEQPYHGNLVHYSWHWFWDFGSGDIGNQGVHQMDIARWAIKDATLPRSVVSMGGRWVDGPSFKDQGQTPNMELSVYDFGKTLLVFETRGLVGDRAPGYPNHVDNEFCLQEGVIRGDKFFPDGKGEGEPLVEVDAPRHPGNIFENFIHCVRRRRYDELHADILEAQFSSALCQLGNISYRLGWEYSFRMKTNALGKSNVVTDSMMTVLENTKVLGIDPARTTYCLGPKLELDAKKERFVDNPAADLPLTRSYRQPFVVPERV